MVSAFRDNRISMAAKNWYDRALRFFRISKRTAEFIGVGFGAIAAIAFTVASIRGFMANTNLKGPEDLLELLGLHDGTLGRVQKTLRSIMRRTESDRAFVFFYWPTKSGEVFSVFEEGYQQSLLGLDNIPPGYYELGKGLSKERYKKHLADECFVSSVEEMNPSDDLTKAFVRSNTKFAISCPFPMKIKGKEVRGAIAVEFSKIPYEDDEDKQPITTDIKTELLESSVDIINAMAKSGVSKRSLLNPQADKR